VLDDRLARLQAQAPGTHVLHGSPHRLNIQVITALVSTVRHQACSVCSARCGLVMMPCWA
jgi:hypothetical protein